MPRPAPRVAPATRATRPVSGFGEVLFLIMFARLWRAEGQDTGIPSTTRAENPGNRSCRLVLTVLRVKHVIYTDAFMDPQRTRVVIREPFYPVHRVYLWASTIQWFACLLLAVLTIAAWRAEDRRDARP